MPPLAHRYVKELSTQLAADPPAGGAAQAPQGQLEQGGSSSGNQVAGTPVSTGASGGAAGGEGGEVVPSGSSSSPELEKLVKDLVSGEVVLGQGGGLQVTLAGRVRSGVGLVAATWWARATHTWRWWLRRA